MEQDFSTVHSYLSRLLRTPAPGRPVDVTEGVEKGREKEKEGEEEDLQHGNEKGKHKGKQKTCDNKTGKNSSSLHTPTYPFDFTAAIAMTDKLLHELPPAALFKLAESDLQKMIIETQ